MRGSQLMRRAVALLVLCGLAAAGSGCNLQWSPYAAKVGSRVISPATLDGALRSASSSKGFRCLLQHSSTRGYRFRGSGSDTYDSAFSSYVLTNLIDESVARSVVQRRHLAEPPSAYRLAAAQVDSALASQLSQNRCSTGTTDVLSSLGPTLEGSFVSLQLDEDALAARAAGVVLTPNSLAAYERTHAAATQENCLSGIFVRSGSVARTVMARLRSGAAFSAMVTKYSQANTSSHGALGCYTAAELAAISPAIERGVVRAGPGRPAGPLAYRGAFLILLVTTRHFEPVGTLLNALFQAHSAAFAGAITKALRSVHVQVNPQYGRWSTGTTATTSLAGFGGRVLPLRAPGAAYVLNESAVRARASSTLSSGAVSGP